MTLKRYDYKAFQELDKPSKKQINLNQHKYTHIKIKCSDGVYTTKKVLTKNIPKLKLIYGDLEIL